MRLTKKDKTNESEPKDIYFIVEKTNDFSGDNQHLANQKLGQLEDIEEKLGIDLVTFFKIRKHCYKSKPIFIKDKVGITKSSCRVELCYDSVAVHTGDYGADIYPLKKYGKTWTLTKEELL